jgi:hypothetical protein
MGIQQIDSYSLGAVSGTMGAGLSAGSPIFSFRWINTAKHAVIRSVRLSAGGITAFTAGFCGFDLIRANTWSAADSSGTLVAWTATTSGKRRLGMSDSGLSAGVTAGEARISSTATLTAGTRTLDTNPIVSVVGSTTATAGDFILPLTELAPQIGHPLVLGAAAAAAAEGFVIRATVPATGTWTFGVSVDWEEVASF